MSKKTICPTHKPNQKRAEAKNRRGRGRIAMATAKMDEAEWSQKHDPLFHIKGKERHNRTKG